MPPLTPSKIIFSFLIKNMKFNFSRLLEFLLFLKHTLTHTLAKEKNIPFRLLSAFKHIINKKQNKQQRLLTAARKMFIIFLRKKISFQPFFYTSHSISFNPVFFCLCLTFGSSTISNVFCAHILILRRHYYVF